MREAVRGAAAKIHSGWRVLLQLSNSAARHGEVFLTPLLLYTALCSYSGMEGAGEVVSDPSIDDLEVIMGVREWREMKE